LSRRPYKREEVKQSETYYVPCRWYLQELYKILKRHLITEQYREEYQVLVNPAKGVVLKSVLASFTSSVDEKLEKGFVQSFYLL
jgi:hypothetical protein